jgi:kumamolisin
MQVSAVHSYFKRLDSKRLAAHKRRQPTAPPPAPWTIPALCAAYNWPTGAPGGGVIAIVELGGGWNQADVNQAFEVMGQPTPTITDVSVDGTQNSPGSDDDAEVALDIQVAGASYFVATGQPANIRVYWSQDIASAVSAATADGCDVCSISWGADEASWGQTAGAEMETTATAATAAGMVVFAAAGDNDASDGGANAANVDLPASAPHVVGCGGTSKPPLPSPEVVWNNNPGNADGEGTGGGFSTLFPPQSWQIGVPKPPSSAPGHGRMVPDVSADADPATGYQIVLDGQPEVVGGTSAVAPLYAGLFAAFGSKLGYVTPKLFQNQTAFNDITQGNNGPDGMYNAGPGPDPCTGIGSPIGEKIAALFVAAAIA